jgi:chemotaxis signal transduction protein
VLDGKFSLGRRPGTDYPQIRIFQCMLQRTDAITNEVLELITFVLASPTLFASFMGTVDSVRILHKTSLIPESQAFLESTNK